MDIVDRGQRIDYLFSIPIWKCAVLCVFRFRRWMIARAYNLVAKDLFDRGHEKMCWTVMDYGIEAWEDVLGRKDSP
jgi:hypothetical protein